jgi:hypothetical protein
VWRRKRGRRESEREKGSGGEEEEKKKRNEHNLNALERVEVSRFFFQTTGNSHH